MMENVTNLQKIRELTGNNETLMRKYVNIFLSNSPQVMTELKEKIEGHELGAAKVLAHSLIPQVLYMGMEKEKQKLKEIEDLCLRDDALSEIKALYSEIELGLQAAYRELNAVAQ
jgi:HPt (histidine-containing phosphotransfer) domain-containing protein